MDDLTVFEGRFEDRLRRFAIAGVGPVDAAAVAHAVAVGQPRGHGPRSSIRWPGLPLDRRFWTIVLALWLLVALAGGALLVGAGLLPRPPLDVVSNGWIAFTVAQPTSGDQEADHDIWLVRLDREARRVVGSETDRVNQLCPAFSPDGRSLAYGRVEGHGEQPISNADGTEGIVFATYRQAAMVVAGVAHDGGVSDRLAIEVGDGLPPPCPVWSPDGEHLAFGVNRTSPVSPEKSAAGSEVWIVTLADHAVTVLPDLLATDLEWSPDGSLLAVASGTRQSIHGEALQDGLIRLCRPASGAMRPLEATSGALELTWSPDGGSIAYAGLHRTAGDDHRDLRVVDIETGRERTLADRYGSLHGIGPVWSPDGATIAFQRGFSGEHSEVVLSTPGDASDPSAHPREVIVPVTDRASSERLDPYRATWSPDGRYLLMMAWGHPPDAPGTDEDPFLVAIPVDQSMPKVVLSRIDGLVATDGYDDTTFVPIQTWGREPAP